MANFDSARNDINTPGTGYFVPAVDIVSMSMDTLQANYKTLQDQIKVWNDRYAVGNSSEKNNISYILQVQGAKLSGYQTAISDLQAHQMPTADNISSSPDAPTTTATTATTGATATSAPVPPKSNKTKYIVIGSLLLLAIATVVIVYKRKHHG